MVRLGAGQENEGRPHHRVARGGCGRHPRGGRPVCATSGRRWSGCRHTFGRLRPYATSPRGQTDERPALASRKVLEVEPSLEPRGRFACTTEWASTLSPAWRLASVAVVWG